MKCSEARERILAASIDDAVRGHMRACEACAELGASDGSLGQVLGRAHPQKPAPDGFDALISAVREEDAHPLSKLRSMPTAQRIAIAMAAAVVGGALMLGFGRRADWSSYPMMQMLLVLGSMTIAVGFAIVLSMPRVYRPERPLGARLVFFVFLLAVPFIPALLPIPEATLGRPENALEAAGKCIGLGTLMSFPVLLTIRALQRERTWGLSSTVYAALAAAIGANIALQVHCPVGDPAHVVFAHALLGVLYAGLAWAIVRVSFR